MRAKYRVSCAVAALLSGLGGAAFAADATSAAESAASPTGVEEIVVTAQRRDETVQNVPMTVQAITGATLSQLSVTTFDDVLKYTPNVTFGNNGPGQGNIFMRGLSAGQGGDQSSATAGNFPNVAVYLNDESMQFPARNLDIYLVDMQRVEVLEGPQGTLFGGGAEAGAIRYITNKPKLNVFEGNAEASYGYTEHGDPNSSANATLNIPVVEDKLAIRLTIYDERRGGYIDNVPSTFTRSNQDVGNSYLNILPTGGICPNGLPPGNISKSLPTGNCTLANAPQANNYALAQDAQNPTTYTGARLSALYEITPDWNVLIEQSFQNMNAEGVSQEEPYGSDFQKLAPLEVTTFSPSYDKDKFENTAWTVNGKLADFKLIYTGSYLVRNIDQQMDYTNYARGAYGAYYQCAGGATGWGKGAPVCYSPIANWHDTVRNTHFSNEFRVASPDTWRLRLQGGAYYEQFRIYDNMNFNYKSLPSCTPSNLTAALAGGPICVADVATAPGSTANDPGVRPDNTAFGEDTQRGYDQTAVFVSFDFDIIPKVLTVSGGTRWYQYSEFEVGSQYATNGSCLNVPNGECGGGVVNINNNHDHVVYTGFKSRANVTWHITPDTLVYYTFSQGFRPGGFNRSTSAVADLISGDKASAQYEKPNSYAPDSLTNHEIGLKSEFFDHRLQLDVSAYYMMWDNVQFLFFNPTELGNTTFGVNGPNYHVEGIETQFVGRVTEGLTVQGSASYDDDRQANSPCLLDNIPGTPAYGGCITQVKGVAFENPFGSAGSVPAFSPEFQGNLRARYERHVGPYKAFVAAGVNYTGSMYNEPATYTSGVGVVVPATTLLRYLQPGYTTCDASFGISKDKWTAQVFGTNLGNSGASTFTSSAQFIKSEVPLRPRVIGVKIAASF
jgi:outer membrane receptor protein involved in Fe transport